jgi:hypothetical protein
MEQTVDINTVSKYIVALVTKTVGEYSPFSRNKLAGQEGV